MGHESSHFQKICFADSFCDAIFKRFDESNKSNESSQILSTIDLRIRTNPWDSDSRICMVFKRFVSWIRFVLRCSKDSFRGFVSWIRFVDLFLKDLFRGFVLWKIFFLITRFVSFRKDSYTNPASLILWHCDPSHMPMSIILSPFSTFRKLFCSTLFLAKTPIETTAFYNYISQRKLFCVSIL